jgi:hypothetical protein
MLSRKELETIKSTILALAADRTTRDVSASLEALDWAIEAETEMDDMRAAGAFKCAKAYSRYMAKKAARTTPQSRASIAA